VMCRSSLRAKLIVSLRGVRGRMVRALGGLVVECVMVSRRDAKAFNARMRATA